MNFSSSIYIFGSEQKVHVNILWKHFVSSINSATSLHFMEKVGMLVFFIFENHNFQDIPCVHIFEALYGKFDKFTIF